MVIVVVVVGGGDQREGQEGRREGQSQESAAGRMIAGQ